MSRQPTFKPDDPAQSQRFIELAKQLGADESDADLQAVIKRLGKHEPEPRRKVGKKRQRPSKQR